MYRPKWIALTAVSAAIAVGLAGCGKTKEGDGQAAAGGDAQALYKKHCVSCHGDQLQGRMGPKTDLRKVGARMSREQIAVQIADGGGGMPGFGKRMNEAEIRTLADWLAAMK